jgi:hypothetical protein
MPNADQKRRWRLGGCLWLTLLSLILYGLSIGPLCVIDMNYADDNGVYKPIWLLEKSSPACADVIHDYLHFWQGLIGPCGRWPWRH